MSLNSAALVSVLALLAPLVIRLGRLPVPDAVLLIILGIIVGPQGIGWARVDEPVQVLSTIGLSFLLFVSGLEIRLDQLGGKIAQVALKSFILSSVLALAVGGFLRSVHLVHSALLVAVIFSATALGVIVPVLKDSDAINEPVGKIVVAGASLAEIFPVVLLSLLFSEKARGLGSQVTLLTIFGALVAIVGLLIFSLEKWHTLRLAFQNLQNTTAEIRVRAAVALLLGFAALATSFGLEAILGAFLAGVAISLLDKDTENTHPLFRTKLQAVGFGALIPYFFVATGMSLNVRSFHSVTTISRIPIFLAALIIARGIPAFLYSRVLSGKREVLAAALLQSTTLSIPVVGGTIGVHLGLIPSENFVAMVAAALVSVVVFPVTASILMRNSAKNEGSQSQSESRINGSVRKAISTRPQIVDDD
ncbi:cation:proton antiporter (plasmid) [Streptomyces sp. AHU1]|uniref:cation:proton antiporter n=1 Tax=Streptomyces sp. AHU1 TaxID=3377215 RepID=UPI0038781205